MYTVKNISNQKLELRITTRTTWNNSPENVVFHLEPKEEVAGVTATGLAMLQECLSRVELNRLLVVEENVLVSNWKDAGF